MNDLGMMERYEVFGVAEKGWKSPRTKKNKESALDLKRRGH